MNMNDVIVSNQGKPPGIYELPRRGNGVLPSRSGNVVDQIFRFAGVAVDVGRRKITRGDQEVTVTRAEYNLLLYFLKNVDRALARDAILNAAWVTISAPIAEQWMCTSRAFGVSLNSIPPRLVIS
jgi:DNA-binding response OmpR family regulator